MNSSSLSKEVFMIDISSAKLDKIVIHKVGNKIRDEGYNLSSSESNSNPQLNELLLRYYLSPFIRTQELFDFYHESDISLNPIRNFSNNIFNGSDFVTQSQNIAKHLYSVSNHSNIVGGEVIILYFSDIRYDLISLKGLAILRIENKDDYLDIEDNSGTFQLIEKSGISLNKIQKGALILSDTNLVFAIDSLSQKTKYWFESFLKVTSKQTSKACAKAGGALIKALSVSIKEPYNSFLLHQELQKNIDENENISIGKIKQLSAEYLNSDVIEGIFSGVKERIGFELSDDLEIATKELNNYTKKIITKTLIQDGVNLVITNPKAKITELSIVNMDRGFRAIIDVNLMGDK